MSNPDKHKPLSPEELFKLLDSESSKASDFDGLDDFEKDALEGFSAHSNAQKAKVLTEELNIAISKKVNETDKGSFKSKVIWFSAAASIALVITMSIFIFNQSKDESKTNLALNEAQDNAPAPKELETEKPLETITDEVSSLDKQKEPESKISEKSQITVANQNAVGGSVAVLGATSTFAASENKPKFKYEALAKDESKTRNEGEADDRLKQEIDLLDKGNSDAKTRTQPSVAAGAVSGKEKNKLEEEQVNNETAANQNVVTISTTNAANTSNTKAASEDGYYKAEKNVAQEEVKKKAEKPSKLSKESADMDKANSSPDANRKTDLSPASVADNKTSSAYYVGSELAIRDYVESYFKEKTIAASLSGKYKVIGSVDNKGQLKVGTISEIGANNCGCKEDIKKALNSMTKWISASDGKKSISSNVEFVISF